MIWYQPNSKLTTSYICLRVLNFHFDSSVHPKGPSSEVRRMLGGGSHLPQFSQIPKWKSFQNANSPNGGHSPQRPYAHASGAKRRV